MSWLYIEIYSLDQISSRLTRQEIPHTLPIMHRRGQREWNIPNVDSVDTSNQGVVRLSSYKATPPSELSSSPKQTIKDVVNV
jgi:hypothetical protein